MTEVVKRIRAPDLRTASYFGGRLRPIIGDARVRSHHGTHGSSLGGDAVSAAWACPEAHSANACRADTLMRPADLPNSFGTGKFVGYGMPSTEIIQAGPIMHRKAYIEVVPDASVLYLVETIRQAEDTFRAIEGSSGFYLNSLKVGQVQSFLV